MKYIVGTKVYLIKDGENIDWYIKNYVVDPEPKTVLRVKTIGILPDVEFLYDIGETEVEEATYGGGWGYVTRWIKEDRLVTTLEEGKRVAAAMKVKSIDRHITTLQSEIQNLVKRIEQYEVMKNEQTAIIK